MRTRGTVNCSVEDLGAGIGNIWNGGKRDELLKVGVPGSYNWQRTPSQLMQGMSAWTSVHESRNPYAWQISISPSSRAVLKSPAHSTRARSYSRKLSISRSVTRDCALWKTSAS